MRSRAIIFVITLLLVGAACSDDETAEPAPDTAEPTTTTSGDTSTTTTDTTTTTTDTTTTEAPPLPGDDGSGALDFFRSTEPICIEHADEFGNPRPEPEQFADAEAVERLDDDLWQIVDGAGNDLIVDLADEVIYSIDGPEGILPPEYSFGCPPELYLGGLAS